MSALTTLLPTYELKQFLGSKSSDSLTSLSPTGSPMITQTSTTDSQLPPATHPPRTPSFPSSYPFFKYTLRPSAPTSYSSSMYNTDPQFPTITPPPCILPSTEKEWLQADIFFHYSLVSTVQQALSVDEKSWVLVNCEYKYFVDRFGGRQGVLPAQGERQRSS